METSQSKNIRVGLFVSAGLGLLLVSILLLSRQQSPFKSYFNVYLELEEAQGLAQGSVVSLAGLPIGNVGEIFLNKDNNRVQVELRLDQDYQSRITQGSSASVRTQGALGDKFIYISPGERNNPPLQDGDSIEFDADGDFLSNLKNNGPDLEQMAGIISETRELLRRINVQNRSEQVMENLVTSSENLKQVLGQATLAIKEVRGSQEDQDNLKSTMKRLAKVLKKIDEGQGTLGALINDPTLHDKLVGLLGDSPRTKYIKPLLRQSIKSRTQRQEEASLSH
jgi:phospholipid/cholesterol/gamma-HCH transport system substrate-binding protein